MTQGLPLNQFLPGSLKEGSSVTAYNGTLSFFNRAPHPNAAKLWMEYLYSDEGQLGWASGFCHPIRFEAMSAAGTIPEDVLSQLPSTEGAYFPTIEEIEAARERRGEAERELHDVRLAHCERAARGDEARLPELDHPGRDLRRHRHRRPRAAARARESGAAQRPAKATPTRRRSACRTR